MDSVPNGIPSGILENLVVERAWRGEGVGRQLLQFAIDVCRSKCCFELSMSSRLGNEDAHRFYESVGLRKKGYTFAVKTAPDRC
jgi:GNAT superfamily N-acetyltransferase